MKTWTIRAALALVAAFQFPAAAQEADFSQAEKKFEQLCSGCHGEDGEGGDRAPALINNRGLRRRTTTQIQDLIRTGTTGGMPAFPLPEAELQALATWLHSLNSSAFNSK